MPAPLGVLLARHAGRLIPTGRRWVVTGGARSFALAAMATRLDGPLLVVVPGERDAEDLFEDLALFTDHAFLVPAWETLPFEHVSPNETTMAMRSQGRHLLRTGEAGLVAVASVRAALQRLASSDPSPIEINRGGEVDVSELAGRLARFGYQRTHRVEARGEFAIRGGIVDLFPAQAESPVRIDLWGDSVEDLRNFSPSDQRSAETVDHVAVFPGREFRPEPGEARRLATTDPWAASTWDRLAEGQLFSGMESWLPWLAPEASLLDELPSGGRVVMLDPTRVYDRGRELVVEEFELAKTLAPTWGAGAPEAGDHPALYLDPKTVFDRPGLIEMPNAPTGPDDPVLAVGVFEGAPGVAASVAGALTRLVTGGYEVIVAMDGDHAASRVANTLAGEGLMLNRPTGSYQTGSAVIGTGIHRGFVLSDLKVAVLGEAEIAGRKRAHRRTMARSQTFAQYRDLTPGDYVVHHRHGIGSFEGLVTRSIAGTERDYLVIGYAAEDRLYVPTDQLAAVTRYTGGETPRLSRMGGADWSATKDRVRKAVAVVAEQVVALHRARAAATGYAYSSDGPWQRELEDGFAYEETPDQLTTIAQVKADMETDRPMDRLIFGDVGFGKTEIALRAVFKAVTESKQAAILCPTTLLAQQHHQTFGERFAPFPVNVEMLSRFLTTRQQSRVVDGLLSGEVDVVIGTHRLLSDDVRFANLGLLIVDEEQRFGVNAKDALKRLKVGVDVLTLTATPIPRTLEMALTGLREVSSIRTPPEDRHPILTYVGPYDTQTVAAAIRREMLREGQVFYVHNRIQSIGRALAQLQALVPEASFVSAHGRMSEGQLEQVMIDFWNGEHNVLVSTTIIESGLDLPQVNTLIVERADMLGLAQLYQLRGRVGRSSRRAYAYLMHPSDQVLTEEAHRRLQAIGEATDLGAGFQIALKDLEIRGAGSILGEVQSGHISAVGFDLYADMVAEAVGKLEGRDVITEPAPEVRIELPVDAHLPDVYVPDLSLRLEAYRRLASATRQDEVEDVENEWRDRFGPLPQAAATLIDIARLRVEALRIGLTEVVRLRDEVRIGPVDFTASQEVRLQRLAPKAVLRATEGLLFLPAPGELLAGLIGFLREMWPPVEKVEAG